MIENSIEILIIKYCTNQIESDELQYLTLWLKDNNNKIVFQKYLELNYDIEESKPINFVDKEQTWRSINKHINAKSRKNHFWKYAVAASILLLISIGIGLNYDKIDFNNNQELVETPAPIIDNNISIGSDKATLTLEDGSNITLEKGQDYVADNVESNGEELVYKASNKNKPEIAFNYLTIPRGGEFFVQLADGTSIWLNSESQLKYPVTFVDGESRKVELVYGEAYFEVSPSTKHNGSKFIVNTQMQEVEVLGTGFNVKAYQDENSIYTTLVEGKVVINNGVARAILKPGEQSKIITTSNDKDIKISNVDVFTETAWKNGFFSFKDKTLKEIATVLTRWYDVDIKLADEKLENVHFKGVLSKKQKIEEILTNIKNTNFIESYEINGNSILIK